MSGNRIVRIVIYTIELLLLYVLQTTRGLVPEFSGTRPLMLVCAAMMIALFEGDVTGLIFGIAAGLLIDMGGADVLKSYVDAYNKLNNTAYEPAL